MSFFVLPSWYLFNWFILNSLFFSFSLLSSFFVFCCNFIFPLSVSILTVIPSIYRVIKFFHIIRFIQFLSSIAITKMNIS